MPSEEKKALIRVGYSCNNNCVFCHTSFEKNKNLTTLEIKKKIILCKKEGYNFVVLSGGEPTIRTDIFEIAKFVKKNRMKLGLITNGRMFSYDSFLRKLIKDNLRYAYISLLGSKESIHNQITRSNSFYQTIKGIKNIVKNKSLEYKINVTVISKNIDDLKNIVSLASKIKVKNLKFSSVDCKGKILEDNRLVPKLSLTAEKIKEAVDYCKEKGITPYVSDFPVCILGGYSRYIDNLKTNGIEVMSEVSEDKLYSVDNNDKIKPSICLNCESYNSCLGIDKNYFSMNGSIEIEERKKRGNSVPYILTKKFKKIICKNVPKNIKKIVFHNGDYALYEFSSDNFTKKDILSIKNLGQVYLPENRNIKKGFLNGIKLKEESKCRNCNKRDVCARIFILDARKVFEQYIESIRKHIKNLNGNTLDIGCGDIYLKDLFSEMINKNKIKYTGIDPIKIKKEPKFRIINSRFEDYNFKQKRFDNILLLGSYNHLYDLNGSLKKIFRMLKKGGCAIFSDNTPPIVLGNKKNKVRKSFEHYRNHNGYQARLILKKIGFKVINHQDISSKTSNNWIVTVRK